MTTPARIEELERLYARLRPIMDYDDLSADRNALWTLWVGLNIDISHVWAAHSTETLL